jgi:hypothetical protein
MQVNGSGGDPGEIRISVDRNGSNARVTQVHTTQALKQLVSPGEVVIKMAPLLRNWVRPIGRTPFLLLKSMIKNHDKRRSNQPRPRLCGTRQIGRLSPLPHIGPVFACPLGHEDMNL